MKANAQMITAKEKEDIVEDGTRSSKGLHHYVETIRPDLEHFVKKDNKYETRKW